MNYYLNEYSLRGQFKDINEFFQSLREYTLPVLNRIQKNKENVIWKKDIFWQCKVCKNYSIADIAQGYQRKNERSPELTALKVKLLKLISEEPFWGNDEDLQIVIVEYHFDKVFSGNFEIVNCFYKAVQDEGRIVSFIHEEYSCPKLWLIVRNGQDQEAVSIDNIYTPVWWEKEPEIKTWRIEQKYLIEVRANEPSFHPPHFHAVHNEFSAVFRLSDGSLYRQGSVKWPPQMIKEIFEWYLLYKDDLLEAWECLHNDSHTSKFHEVIHEKDRIM